MTLLEFIGTFYLSVTAILLAAHVGGIFNIEITRVSDEEEL